MTGADGTGRRRGAAAVAILALAGVVAACHAASSNSAGSLVASNGAAPAAAAATGAALADPPPDWGAVLPGADAARGKTLAVAKCGACHIFDLDGPFDGIGPDLIGVVGRIPGGFPGYRYSLPLQAFAQTHPAWTYDLLYQFLKSPGQVIPGTKMTFYGLAQPQDRIDVIAYLRLDGSAHYPLPAPAQPAR